MSSYFASRHRKDLSTEMIRTKIAHRKSLSQKENRYKEYERNRHFGLKDVNIPPLQSKTCVELDETSQELVQKASVKPKSVKTILSDQRKQMLQKYKEEKQLQKLKEQREKAKRGVFKVGLYRPDVPSFFSSTQNVRKAEPKKATSSSGRITRSKAKDQMEPSKIPTRSDIRTAQPGERQATSRRALDRENRVVTQAVPVPTRMTRSATQATQQVPRTLSAAPVRKPATRAALDNEPERKAPIKGRPATKIETKADKVVSFKVHSEEKTSQTSSTSGTDPDEALPKMEKLPKTNPAKTRGKNSFAPRDFVFQPLSGVKTYQVTPMTPRSAEAFLTPCYTWDLKPQGDKIQETSKEILASECKTYSTKTLQQESSNLPCPLDSEPVFKEERDLNQSEVATRDCSVLSATEALPPTPEAHEGPVPQPQHDVLYFRNILRSETEKLTLNCLAWDRKLELDLPDNAKDLIRTAVGQTRLLMKERFRQFEGLVDDCEYKRGEKETTCTDLDGFWDMVSFQIEDVNNKFINLTKLEESQWQNSNTSKKVLRKKPAHSAASKPREDDSGRAAAKSRLAAIKSAMRERLRRQEEAGAGGAPDTIVFDAGFFRVESPAKPLSEPSCERLSQRLGAPQSVTRTVPEHRADLGLRRQMTAPEKPSPWSAHCGHGDKKTLFSNTPESRNSTAEGAQCSGSQDLFDVNPDVNKTDFEMGCLPGETVNSHLPEGGVADDATASKEESSGVTELSSSVPAQDVLMSSPEKNSPAQSNILQTAAAQTSQLVLFDTEGLTTEHHLLDSPGLAGSSPFAPVEWGRPRGTRLVSFGGNLIAFSPSRPSVVERPED
ncbi:disks large-associated protein 5 [Fukomys damarensis]|uniref:Disks large-associated protein 5 n=1 Tax=Fukomys damarensis TaxID=885580 RepID=A0A091DHH2_FUKDA|nr:disks large-associated protein 5 [Fukomys damarensis]KFO29695.1 Disks large-associated protein 5 [Fukomys damarensis]